MIAITTIDALPFDCCECPCHDGESGYCRADKGRRYSEYRPYWCPLKEIHGEQEAVKLVNVRWEMGIRGGDCPKCLNWVQRSYNYCPFCGKAVRWE